MILPGKGGVHRSESFGHGEGGMEETVARLNIEHYRQLLATETDTAKRQILMRLLAEEEEKLRLLSENSKTRKQSA